MFTPRDLEGREAAGFRQRRCQQAGNALGAGHPALVTQGSWAFKRTAGVRPGAHDPLGITCAWSTQGGGHLTRREPRAGQGTVHSGAGEG